MSSFAYGRLTRDRERFSPVRGAALDAAVRMAQEPGAPAEDVKSKLAGAARETGGGVAGGAAATTKPGVGSFVDAMAALVPAEALVFFAAASSIAGLVTTRSTVANGGTAETVTTVADVDGAVWLIVLSLLFSLALFVIGKFGTPWGWLDTVRALIPPLAFMLWLLLQERSMFWLLWDRSAELPGWLVPQSFSWNPFVIKVTAVFGAVLLPLLAGALGVMAEQSNPKAATTEASGRKAGGRGGAPSTLGAETNPST